MIALHKARPDQQRVANSHVAALCLGADVDALCLAALAKVLPGDVMAIVRVVVDPIRFGIAAVVKEDATASDAMFGPVVDATFQGCMRTLDVASCCLGESISMKMKPEMMCSSLDLPRYRRSCWEHAQTAKVRVS